MNGWIGVAAALAEKLSLVICVPNISFAPNISFPYFAFVNLADGFNKLKMPDFRIFNLVFFWAKKNLACFVFGFMLKLIKI